MKLFKSSSPLQTETAAVLTVEALLATGQGPRADHCGQPHEDYLDHRLLFRQIDHSYASAMQQFMQHKQMCKINYTLTSLKGKYFLNGEQASG